MANTLLTPQIIANEALMVLTNNLVMANLVHRDYSNEFVNVGDTITVRKPAKFVAKNFTGTVSAQDITEGSVTVKMDRFRDITVPITSKELTLDIKDFSAQVVTPAMQSLAEAIDSDLVAVALSSGAAANAVTGDGTATTPVDIAKAAKALDVQGVPVANRNAVLSPTHKYRYLTGNMANAAYSGDVQALREASLGKLFGFDTYMDQACPSVANTGSATAFKVTATAGATSVALSSLSAATATVKAGDAFIIDGYMYRFTEDKTGSSSAIASVGIDQPIHKAFTNEDATVVSGAQSACFHRNGIALVTRNLELPMGASNAYIASADGIAVRVVFDYDAATKTDKISFDTIYGVKALEDKAISVITG